MRFDLARLEIIGPAVPAIEGIATIQVSVGGAQVAVSADGTIVYLPGIVSALATPIDWLSRDGKTSPLRADKADWANPRFSPDGQKLAIDISDGKQRDVWVYDVALGTLTQLTFDAANDAKPVWTPDGRRIVFASDRVKPGVPKGERRRHRAGVAADRQSKYPVASFLGSERQVSGVRRDSRRDGGRPDDPADGGRCHARMDARHAHSVPGHESIRGRAVRGGRGLVPAQTPKVWSSTSVRRANPSNSAYDLHPDDKRIAAAAVVDQSGILQDKVVFVFNFAEYLAKIAPGKK